ncbi:MAG: bifunctional phosphoribosylaminoimidazolecarboxamide formyltransferase/IMP cyclohydrolase [Candidatus Levybacteria bacterium]|nr:bifunctional phosphoribosylaminoimidazolecarboxamide formyltransferase/IMP cyclohydrolase [Candidatus Levybacteria bacterium]
MKRKTDEKYALLSVYDKTGIVDFARKIEELGYKIISTGGTAKTLTENGVKVVPIQKITGNPESFDGRMKTISFQIESGILFDRSNPSHIKQAEELNIKPIDIVACNLYPFEKTVAGPKVNINDAVENIDVGGPTMVRAAAKNFKSVLVVVDPEDYEKISNYLKNTELYSSSEQSKSSSSRQARTIPDFDIRQELAAKAFAHLSFYDSQIANYLNKNILFPKEITIPGRLLMNLRYGENPHQKGAVYLKPNTNSPFNSLKRLWGREASLINITDINAGLEVVKMFKEPAAVVIKHNSPCGIALGKTTKEALERSIAGDPESAFGGIVVLNKPMDMDTAEVINSFKETTKGNMDIIASPDIDEKTLNYLKTLRKSMGIYTFGKLKTQNSKLKTDSIGLKNEMNLKWIDGGFVLQTVDDNIDESFKNWKIVTKIKPNKKQLEQMKVAWKFVTRIRSNSIIIVDRSLPMTRGIGSGQTSRFRSTQIALKQAGKHVKDGILASDSFFPFGDSIKMAGKDGIGAVIQQGGSINDKASIQTADELGIPMVFTGRRAFWH